MKQEGKHIGQGPPVYLRWYLNPLFKAVPELEDAWNDPLAEWARGTQPNGLLLLTHSIARTVFPVLGLLVFLYLLNNYGLSGFISLLLISAILSGYSAYRRRIPKRYINNYKYLVRRGNYNFTSAIESGNPYFREPWHAIPLNGERAANLIMAEHLGTLALLERGLTNILVAFSVWLLYFLFSGISATEVTFSILVVFIIMSFTNWQPIYITALKNIKDFLPVRVGNPFQEYVNPKTKYTGLLSNFFQPYRMILACLMVAFIVVVEFGNTMAPGYYPTIIILIHLLMLFSLYRLSLHMAKSGRNELLQERQYFIDAWNNHWPEIACEVNHSGE